MGSAFLTLCLCKNVALIPFYIVILPYSDIGLFSKFRGMCLCMWFHFNVASYNFIPMKSITLKVKNMILSSSLSFPNNQSGTLNCQFLFVAEYASFLGMRHVLHCFGNHVKVWWYEYLLRTSLAMWSVMQEAERDREEIEQHKLKSPLLWASLLALIQKCVFWDCNRLHRTETKVNELNFFSSGTNSCNGGFLLSL